MLTGEHRDDGTVVLRREQLPELELGGVGE